MDLTMLRTPDEIPENAPSIVRESPGYFRGVPSDTLTAAGILDFDTKFAKQPAWPPEGVKKRRAHQLRVLFEPPADDDPDTSVVETAPTWRELQIMQRYVSGYLRTRCTRSRKQGKVPAFKFGSNDGWIVTAEECLIIAYRLRLFLLEKSAGTDDDPEFVEAFAAFNEVAAKYGGYDVW